LLVFIRQAWKKARRQLRQHTLSYILGLYLMFNVTGIIGIFIFEYGTNDAFQSIWDIIWFTIVTSTTVGYGDKYPITIGGQMVAIFIMVFGIGLLGMLLAETSSQLVERRLKKKMGKLPSPQDKHILILGWNHKGKTIIREILDDESGTEITVLASLGETPYEHEGVVFVKGNPSLVEDLKKAGVERARSAILLMDESESRGDWNDARTVLVALTIHKIRPSLPMTAEVQDIENVTHLKNAGVRDCIVMSEISSHMLVRSAFYASANAVVSELLTNEGNEIVTIRLPGELAGQTFAQSIQWWLDRWQSIPIGVVRGEGHQTNPPGQLELKEGDRVVLITSQEQEIRKTLGY
jgi:voltage-gated potassium channel